MISPFLRAAAIAAPLILAACGGASSNGPTDAAATPSETEAPAATAAPQDMVLGAADAPVTVIEYASVTCPHCATFHETVFPSIKANYIDTGKVRYIFREFPTPPAEFSYIGSVLARCAADKGGSDAYFLVIDGLFRTQRTWIYGEEPKAELLKIAGQVGMDEAAFDACIKRQELVDLINANVQEGSEKYAINSTPSFVINGEKATLTAIEDLSKELDAALAKAKG